MVFKKGDATDYWIYQLQLIFKYQHKYEEEHYLVYRKCFKYRSFKKCDAETGMWVVDKTDNYEVIPVSSVMCKVYLILFFNSWSSLSSLGNPDLHPYSFECYLVNCYSDSYALKYFSWEAVVWHYFLYPHFISKVFISEIEKVILIKDKTVNNLWHLESSCTSVKGSCTILLTQVQSRKAGYKNYQ